MTGTTNARDRRRRIVWGSGGLALLLAGVAGFTWSLWAERAEPGILRTSGRIEGTEVSVGTKVAGRVERLLVKEADRVAPGQPLAEISSEELRAVRDAARAGAERARAEVEQARQQVAAWDLKVEEARQELRLTEEETRGRVEAAEAGLRAATAAVAQARAEAVRATQDLRRYEDLLAEGAIAPQVVDHARAAQAAARARVDQAVEEEGRAAAALRLAQAGRLLVPLKETVLQTAAVQRRQAERALAAAGAAEAAARARLREVEATLADTRIVAPAGGTVVTRMAEPGEVVAVGTPLLTLVDLDALYLKAYVPEADVGRLRLGGRARVRVDAFPGRDFEATVAEVSPEAEFTPKTVETQEERVKLVFWVKLRLRSPDGLLKPGMPADGFIYAAEPGA